MTTSSTSDRVQEALNKLASTEKMLEMDLPNALVNLSTDHLEHIKAVIEVELRERDAAPELNIQKDPLATVFDKALIDRSIQKLQKTLTILASK